MKQLAFAFTLLVSIFSAAQTNNLELSNSYIHDVTNAANPEEVDPSLKPIDSGDQRAFTNSINGTGYNIPAMVSRYEKNSLIVFTHFRTQKFGHIVEWSVSPEQMLEVRRMFKDLNVTDSTFTFVSANEYYFTRLADSILYFFNPSNDSIFHTAMYVEWTEGPARLKWKSGMEQGCAGTAEMMSLLNGISPTQMDSVWQPVASTDTTKNLGIQFGLQSKVVTGPTQRWRAGEGGPFIQKTESSFGEFVIYVSYEDCGEVVKQTILTHHTSSRSSLTNAYVRNDKNELEWVLTERGTSEIYFINNTGFLYRYDSENEVYIFTFASSETWNNYFNSFRIRNQKYISNLSSTASIRRSILSTEERERLEAWKEKQTENRQSEPKFSEYNFVNVESRPRFPDCDMESEEEAFICFQRSISLHLAKEFKYPELSRQMGSQGKVWVDFIIEKDGYVNYIVVARSSGDEYIDAEAMRCISTLPQLQPANAGGNPVRMRYTVPLNARLQ